jgi:hypothetical protein
MQQKSLHAVLWQASVQASAPAIESVEVRRLFTRWLKGLQPHNNKIIARKVCAWQEFCLKA